MAWFDDIEKDDKYSDIQDASFEEKKNINMSDYPDGMIKAAKAMKYGYFDNLFSKRINIAKGAFVGLLLGLSISFYTKKGKYLFPVLGIIGGGISGSMIQNKSQKENNKTNNEINESDKEE